jgi:integrase
VVRVHDLRHTAASLMVAAGVSVIEVQYVLGHTTLAMTADTYTHLQPAAAAPAAAMQKYLGRGSLREAR